ncbi:iron-sulfur cluster assembly accessory protein [Ramicandelaber brevisporus]|nr:iron-sulfur cluster assembly accessory protein [Ramicandelaber brevisporus]
MYTSDIVITDKAASRLAALAKDDSDPNLALRIIVESGGCHGFQYRFELTSERSSDDIVFTKDGGSVVVDNISIDYIAGSTLDFVEELIGSTFKLTENPNAVSGCGCGTSFEIKI